jgi:fatty acid desaturase
MNGLDRIGNPAFTLHMQNFSQTGPTPENKAFSQPTPTAMESSALEGSVSEFQNRLDSPGVKRLAGHLGLLAISLVLTVHAPGLWYWPAAFLQGVVMVFLFCPLHETTHRTCFRSRWLNRLVGELVGFMLLLPHRWFGAFHMAHHRFTQDPDRDPELATGKPTTWTGYLLVLSGAVYWRFAVMGLLNRAMGRKVDRVSAPYLDDRTRPRVVLEARVYLAVLAVIALVSVSSGSWAGSWSAVSFWLLPVALGQPVLRLYLLAEHWGCPTVRDMWQNTRTMRTLAPVRYLAWNMPFHAEHHANPGVPFHRLPDFSRSRFARPEVVQDGYADFHIARLGDLRDGRAGPV